ncbi:MAG TPA: transglycosylase SLT domain-containing protein [Vicinamibacterales bacterium]|nr:transglycosylase SLT domain-containing protein [Vicinamibacterales bacterium]
MSHRLFIFLAAFLVVVPVAEAPRAAAQLGPTAHAALPGALSDLWLVPADDVQAARAAKLYAPLADAVAALGEGDYARALTLASRPALRRSELADHAAYYAGLAQLRLSKPAEARTTFADLRMRKPRGYLRIAAAIGEADAASALGDFAAELAIYEQLAADPAAVTEDTLLRLGRAALSTNDRRKAADSFVRVYYEHPLSDAAIEAGSRLKSLQDVVARAAPAADLGRAARLFGARRYRDARDAYLDLRGRVSGDDHEVVELRIAECDFFLQRYAAARDGLQPWLDRGARRAEARFFHLSALRELGRRDEYISATRALAADFPDSSWSEEALNNLGTFYILANEDAEAARTFGELYAKFPTGTRAERAAWKYGWWNYKNAEYAETIRVFESAAATFPRSDYRPSFLYWAARSHGKLGAGPQAEAHLRLVYTDYGSSYYGRLAAEQLPTRTKYAIATDAVPAASHGSNGEGVEPPNTPTIRLLLAAGLYDDALNELRFAQQAYGTSPALEATMAWAYNRKGELRRAITLMRRAYPQHLTADGHEVPREILEVIFPLTYWDSIRKHAKARGLDPYLIAALIAQESTFDPSIRSSANAWGLMQIVPATGRRLARSLGVRRFSTPMLTNPETNLRLGTLYFSRLAEQFGGVHYALASYNAGENRVVRWKAERPGLEQDEFIDDIPFPETQNYVKRILGTAEDYRRLYGKGGGRPLPVKR